MNDDSNPVFQRALQYLSDLQDGKADAAALFRWLAESPRHVEEFAFALTFTDEIAGLTDEQCAEIAAMNAAHGQARTVVALPNVRALRQPLQDEVALKPTRIQRPFAWAAAVLMAALLGGGLWWWDNGWRTYATDFGEQRVVELTDGSVIHLNTESRVKVRYGKGSRDIRMITGEALFEVERDPLHPFRVYADRSVIQAVGTQFNVHRHASGTTVSVLEGSVRITPRAAVERLDSTGSHDVPPVAVQNLAMGQEVEIAPKGEIIVRQVDATQAAAWRQHRLVFDNDTLADIAAEFNRYNRRPQIRVEDVQAGARKFAATFDADAPESLVQVLKTNSDLDVEQSRDEIVIRSRAKFKSAQ